MTSHPCGIDIFRILSSFGQNTHALADFYAHTNWVDSSQRGGAVCNDLGGSSHRPPARADRLYVQVASPTLHYFRVYEVGYVPNGLGMTTIWDETLSDALFSGTVSLSSEPIGCTSLLGDISCSTDKITHGYWAKDDEQHVGGAELYTGQVMGTSNNPRFSVNSAAER